MNIADLLNLPRLDGDLATLETSLRRAVTTEDPFLSEVASHLVRAGGKRLRPALAVAAAAAGGVEATDAVLSGGVSVELVHLGSLYHDDVMDEAVVRRGVETVNARWGNLVAILAGDFLLARASEIAASLGTEIAGLLAATIGRLCEGQLGELQTAFNVDRSEEAYLKVVAGKTASLMASSCRIGALCAGLERTEVEALTTFGHGFGMAFQVRDDALDVVGTEEALGKAPGQDLMEGIYTLPVIYALADGGGLGLRSLLGRRLAPEERDEARSLVRSSGAIERALAVGHQYADEAAAALAPLGDSPVVSALATAGHRLLDDVPAASASG